MRKTVTNIPRFSDPALSALFAQIRDGTSSPSVLGLDGVVRSSVAGLLHYVLNRTVMVITATEDEARDAGRELSAFIGEDRVMSFPAWSTPLWDTDLSRERDVAYRRAAALSRLCGGTGGVVVASLAAVLQKVAPLDAVGGYIDIISCGDIISRDSFVEKLAAGGYRSVPLVQEEGDFSVRGHILDIFPPLSPRPCRMELFGDEIESLRVFDPVTQRSAGDMPDFMLVPSQELIVTEERRVHAIEAVRRRSTVIGVSRRRRDRIIDRVESDPSLIDGLMMLPLFYGVSDDLSPRREPETLDTIFDYLPSTAVIVHDDISALTRKTAAIEETIERAIDRARSEERFYCEIASFQLSVRGLERRLCRFSTVIAQTFESPVPVDVLRLRMERPTGLTKTPTRDGTNGMLKPFVDSVTQWFDEGYTVVFLCPEPERERIQSLLESYALPVRVSSRPLLEAALNHDIGDGLLLADGSLSGGFIFPFLRLVVVTEEEIYGKKVVRRRRRRAKEGFFLASFQDLSEGDFVVHIDHGIGRYRGLHRLCVMNSDNDYLLVEYRDGDKLYLPAERLDQLQRYIGADGVIPEMDRLGGTNWEKVKKKVTESVREIAEELVALYAAREVKEGHRFPSPGRTYDEFAASFPYEETPDQAHAIDDVVEDMFDARPMDRLVCGDAGFGKTEVAIRASFTAAMDGKQVAVLVPTTILAEQHYQTFRERFDRYPIVVEALNRFKSKRRQDEIVASLASGQVDIVIGTHRLLQKDIRFKDLGLVIIDEEQRFGVGHKEKLKKMRTLVDVLTLTATPIPRTLQLAFTGVRDLSVIDTPPEDRQSVKVLVSEFTDDIIRDAIVREHKRAGQVFFVHDRVQSIQRMAGHITGLAPEMVVGVAHGQMRTRELEDVMVRFLKKEIDVLVCTRIISSGLDIPAANTIIINRADRFGLSELYQLRGRVGRANEDAYAYLLIPRDGEISKEAQKRLQVVQDFTDPGSGMKVAMQDLEIRGGGSILGVSQSGHVAAVGFEMYTELMERTIQELKSGEPVEEELHPEIQLGVSSFIPDDYMTDTHARLMMYKKISMAGDAGAIAAVRDELDDCYGYVPSQVESLLSIIEIRNRLKRVRGRKMTYDGKDFTVLFDEKSSIDPARIVDLAKKHHRQMSFSPDYVLSFSMPGLGESDILTTARTVLADLEGNGDSI